MQGQVTQGPDVKVQIRNSWVEQEVGLTQRRRREGRTVYCVMVDARCQTCRGRVLLTVTAEVAFVAQQEQISECIWRPAKSCKQFGVWVCVCVCVVRQAPTSTLLTA